MHLISHFDFAICIDSVVTLTFYEIFFLFFIQSCILLHVCDKVVNQNYIICMYAVFPYISNGINIFVCLLEFVLFLSVIPQDAVTVKVELAL